MKSNNSYDKKKLIYNPPKILQLEELPLGKGDCAPGSSAAAHCSPTGSSASGGDCDTSGLTAGGTCDLGDAAGLCLQGSSD